MSNKMYDILKWVAQVVLPALGALYYGLDTYWNMPNVTSIVGTIVLVDTFLGVLLGVSNITYNKTGGKYDGAMVIEKPEPGKTLYSLSLDGDPEDLQHKKDVTFKIQKT